jgi:AraC-like DNA-binding protein
MLADIHILHRSDVYQVVDFKCHCNVCSLSQPEYNDSLCISFVRKGFFEYNTFRRSHEAHSGRILVSKPGYEHTTRHIDNQPDITTVFEFQPEFLKEIQVQYREEAGWFLSNHDIHSVLLLSGAETDYLHHVILELIRTGGADNLEVDELVFQLVDKVFGVMTNNKQAPFIADGIKKYHLPTIERAKEYILQHFRENISLQRLAKHCLVSPFHFSRIFKSILQTSPHQYVSAIRLHHARALLGSTDRPVADVAFDCGFSSAEHFATAYKQYFKVNPSSYRKQLS